MFHRLIPLLSGRHRVFAVDLRGFGDSATADAEHTSATAAQDLIELIERLDLGPVHVTGQDISGPTTFRVAATRPELVRSYAAIETGLPGFGLETLADVTHGGAWHIGFLAARASRRCSLPDASAPSWRSTRFPLSAVLRIRSPGTTSTSSPGPTRERTPSRARPGSTARCSRKETRSARWRPGSSVCPCSRWAADRAGSRRRPCGRSPRT
ncbi:alpha/beta fold hydrolase [Streptomyces shenzhenensis]|uniref:alpha/beta fold hydrolase n=1 Tax=Streptomyces shenzhenensis TaxID=943815 RepID=UPI003D93749C